MRVESSLPLPLLCEPTFTISRLFSLFSTAPSASVASQPKHEKKKKTKKKKYMHPFVILLAGYLLCGCKQAQRNRKDRSGKKKK